MTFSWWENFESFAHSSVKLFYENPNVNLATYSEKMTNLVSEVIGEMRQNILDPLTKYYEKDWYLTTIIGKIGVLKENLFEKIGDDLKFIPDKSILTEEDDDLTTSIRLLYKNILRLENEFKSAHVKFKKQGSDNYRSQIKGKRIPLRESFEIVEGKDVNLRAVHRILTEESHPFINPNTPYDVFEKVFSGGPVTIKVNFLEANALHYFISEIYGKGIKRANEGIWARTSKCFTANGKEYTARQLNDTDNPVGSVTILLNKATEHFKLRVFKTFIINIIKITIIVL